MTGQNGGATVPIYGPISYDIDLESVGKRAGNVRLTYSDNIHAASIIPILIGVVVNGEGPTVLMCAGTHGNEYEGQVILRELFGALLPEDIQGRLIIMPSLNMPAVRDDARVSPLDGGNLNRVFPGATDTGPTAAIAGFLAEVILHLCDAGIDIHTGGDTSTFVPLVFLCHCEDNEVFRKSAALAQAFNAPWAYLVTGIQDEGGFDPCAQNQGVAFISTELGGGARLGRSTLEIGRQGVRNMLAHLGVIELDGEVSNENSVTRYVTDTGPDGVLVSEAVGFLETFHEPGTTVSQGEAIARVHPVENGFGCTTTTTMSCVPARVFLMIGWRSSARTTQNVFLVSP